MAGLVQGVCANAGTGPAARPGSGAAAGRAAVMHHRHREPGQVQFQGFRCAPGGHVRAVVVAAHHVHWAKRAAAVPAGSPAPTPAR